MIQPPKNTPLLSVITGLCILIAIPFIITGCQMVNFAKPDQLKIEHWPPIIGEEYPDLELINADNETVHLSDYAGNVLLIEPIGMTCKACQAYAGGNIVGGFSGVKPQNNLESIEEYMPRYTNGTSLYDPSITYIQLIFYNTKNTHPSAEDLQRWETHFETNKHPNIVVLGATEPMIGSTAFRMIPGFQLVDRDFILQADGAGHNPPNNIYTDLLPMVPQLIESF